jgi:hypothetical protein
LGSANQVQGKAIQALECYIAGLAVYPFEQNFDNRRLWTDISLLMQDNRQILNQKQVQRVLYLAGSRHGYFSYLNDIYADRSYDITRIVTQLTSLVH